MAWLNLEEDIAEEFGAQVFELGQTVIKQFVRRARVRQTNPLGRVSRKDKLKFGQCSRCPGVRVSGRSMCAECAEKNRLRVKAVKEHRRAHGLCRECGKSSFGKLYCTPHQKRHNARRTYALFAASK